MLDLSFCGIGRLGGWLAAAVVCVCGAGAIPAQEDESAVALRDAEGYEVPAQGWVKAPSFLLDHLGGASSATVMDIADTADFDDPTTWSLTEQGGEILHEFDMLDPMRPSHLYSPMKFSPNDKWLSFRSRGANVGGEVFGNVNVKTGRLEKKYHAGDGTMSSKMWFRHGDQEVIIYGGLWMCKYKIYVYQANTADKLKTYPPVNHEYFPCYYPIAANLDGSRVCFSSGGFLNYLDVDSGEMVKTSIKTPRYFSRDGTRLLTLNDDGTMDLYDTMTNEMLYTLEDFPTHANSPQLDYFDAATGNHNILLVHKDGSCGLLNTQKPFPYTSLSFTCDDSNALRLSRDGTKTGIISADKTMELWDLLLKQDLKYQCEQFEDFSNDGTMVAGFHAIPWQSGFYNIGRIYSMPPQIRYQSGDLTNGPRTLYVRLRDGEENNGSYTFHYNLDTVAPGRTGKPAAQGGQADGRVKFTWPAASDNAGGSGVANYEFIAESAAGACDEHRAFSGGEPRATIPCATGRMVHFRVRAIDLAGNAGEWSEPVAYYVNAAPEAPALALSPASPGTLDRVTVRASSTDPEGDAIIDTGALWYLDGVLQSSEVTLDPSLTARGQVWTCRARVRDFHGAWSEFSELSFTIGNTPPSQPIVEIKPDPAQPDSDLIVDVMQYSIDPDGDEVGYDFAWFKSVDGGNSWIHKVELDGLPQVSNLFINDGELWRVIYTPYEKESPANLAQSDAKEGGKTPGLNRVEGYYAWDQLLVGGNRPPAFAFGDIWIDADGQGVNGDIKWTVGDPDGDATSVNLYYFDVDYPVLKPVKLFIDEGAGGYQGAIPVTGNLTFRLVALVTDAKGSVTQVVSGEQSVKTATRPNWVIYR